MALILITCLFVVQVNRPSSGYVLQCQEHPCLIGEGLYISIPTAAAAESQGLGHVPELLLWVLDPTRGRCLHSGDTHCLQTAKLDQTRWT